MEPVYELNGLRIVDLTKVLDPKTESRRCHLIRYNTGGPIPDFHTALDLTSHLGTHCECPYHHFENGKSVGELPLTTFMGRAIYVNIDFLEPNSHISGADLDRAAPSAVCGDSLADALCGAGLFGGAEHARGQHPESCHMAQRHGRHHPRGH